MPSAYQTFKNEMFKEIKSKYFTDYKIREGEKIQTLVAQKCKEEWESLPENEKELYKCKSKEQNDSKEIPPPPYKEINDEPIPEPEPEPEFEAETDDDDDEEASDVKEIEIDGVKYYHCEEDNRVFDADTQEQVGFYKDGNIIDINNKVVIKSSKKQERNTKKKKSSANTSKKGKQSIEDIKPEINKVKNKRKKVPKAVKESIWKKYISDTELRGKCFIGCGNDIQINNFEAGHVIPVCEGGENTIENLRPICSLCNKSMGTQNLNDFIKSFGFKDDITKFESEIKTNEKQIIEIDKEIKKTKKSSKMLSDKQIDISKKIEELNELINNTMIELEIVKKTFTSNELKIQELEEIAKQKKKKKEKIKKDTSILVTKKESSIRNKMIEEEKLKDEIRKELLLEQKKEELREQVKREMGLI